MVLLVQKFVNLYSKLENHHHKTHHDHPQEQEEELSASLKAFQSQVSKSIAQLALDLRPGSETLSMFWIQRCFGLLPIVNKEFAKLVVDIDYPMNKWDVNSIEGYLNYTLSLMEILNSLSSSLSHLGHARVSLSHGLTRLENSNSLGMKHLKAIQFQPGCNLSTKSGKELRTEDDKARIFNGKELVVHEAMKEIKSVGFWVCGIFLSGLCSNVKPYMELRKIAGGFENSSVLTLDFKIREQIIEKVTIFKEVKELNDAIAEINLLVDSDEVRDDATMELKTKLNVLEKLLDDISKEVDDLFASVMTHRSELIDCFRLKKQ